MEKIIYNKLVDIFGEEMILTAQGETYELSKIAEELTDVLSWHVEEQTDSAYNTGYEDGRSEGYDQGYEDGIGVN